MSELILKQITKIFPMNGTQRKNIPVLLGLNGTFPSGKLNFVLGPSGCGKTTLLQIICGNFAPSSGEVILNKEKIVTSKGKKEGIKSQIGFLKQNSIENVWPLLSIKENFQLTADIIGKKRSNSEIEREAEKMLLKLLIKTSIDKTVSLLSYGQIQRIGLGILLFRNPDVLLLDEPTSHLDKQNAGSLIHILEKEIATNHQKIIIITTHDQNIASRHSSYVLYNGTFITKNMDQIFSQRHLLRRYYSPTPTMLNDEQKYKSKPKLSGILEGIVIISSSELIIPKIYLSILDWEKNAKIRIEESSNSIIFQQDEKLGSFNILEVENHIKSGNEDFLIVKFSKSISKFISPQEFTSSLNISSKKLILYPPIDD